MALIRLTLPEDFDERCKKYREKLVPKEGMPEPYLVDSLENEKKNLLLIKDEVNYRHEMDKWLPLKTVVDAIYKDLIPFTEKNQSIQLDISKLGIPEKIASSVFMSLVYERLCRWHLGSPVVISTAPIAEYLKGKIVVPSYTKFKEFRQKVHDFYEFMESNKAQKFPKPERPALQLTSELHEEAKEMLQRNIPEIIKAKESFATTLESLKTPQVIPPQILQPDHGKSTSALKRWSDTDTPTFDEKSGGITLGEIKCMIPLSAVNQIVTCKAVFSKPIGEWTQEIDVIHDFYHGENSDRALKDATRAINQKTREILGVDLFQYEGRSRRVRIKGELFKTLNV